VREGVLWGARLAVTAALSGVGIGVGSSAAAAPVDGLTDGPAGEAAAPPGAVDVPMIGGPSTCPLPDAVWAELGTLLPRDRLNARLRAVAGNTGPVVQIIDLGVPYRVIAAGRVREYRDETRDCAYRARIAAVFVALAIDPAEISTEQPSPPPSPPVPAAPPEVTAPRRAAARLDLAAAGGLGVGSGNRALEAGAALRLALGRGRIALVAGGMALAPVDTTVGGVRLRQWRLPVDVGVRAELAGKRFDRYAELGLGAALLSERAPDLASPQSGTSIELGLRASVGARLVTRARFTPFAALDVELVPSPPSLFALPQGVVGHTPWLWIGANVGASLELPGR
jgi:hypothetical protein